MNGRFSLLNRKASQPSSRSSRSSSASTNLVRNQQELVEGDRNASLFEPLEFIPSTQHSAAPHHEDPPPPVPVHRTLPLRISSFSERNLQKGMDLSPIKEDINKSPYAARYPATALQRKISASSAHGFSPGQAARARRSAVPAPQHQLDDNFLRRIRKGPYMPLTPSPNKENTMPFRDTTNCNLAATASLSSLASRRRYDANLVAAPAAAAGSRFLVDKFIESRLRGGDGESPPAFL